MPTLCDDVRAMIRLGMLTSSDLIGAFQGIEGRLIRFPAIDPPAFRTAVEPFCGTVLPDER